jgi:hypothetical protein
LADDLAAGGDRRHPADDLLRRRDDRRDHDHFIDPEKRLLNAAQAP